MHRSALPILGLVAVGTALLAAQPSQARCFASLVDSNECETFTPFQPVPNSAKISINNPSNLGGTKWAQIGFSSVNGLDTDLDGTPPGLPYTITNVSWSLDDVTYTPLAASTLTGVGLDSTSARYLPFFQVSATGLLSTDTLYFKYDLPDSALPALSQIPIYIRTNNNGAQNNVPPLDPYGTPMLSIVAASPIRGDLFTFTSTFKVPGPLPILGAAAAFNASRRLRRRVKASA
ncbi:MAG: hypothetical protein VKO00_05150 [Cyanobacteriota bacterium]|nr:hypothetical protein [Cyanobacteriota bacterium]